jgi:hypothetical protein
VCAEPRTEQSPLQSSVDPSSKPTTLAPPWCFLNRGEKRWCQIWPSPLHSYFLFCCLVLFPVIPLFIYGRVGHAGDRAPYLVLFALCTGYSLVLNLCGFYPSVNRSDPDCACTCFDFYLCFFVVLLCLVTVVRWLVDFLTSVLIRTSSPLVACC